MSCRITGSTFLTIFFLSSALLGKSPTEKNWKPSDTISGLNSHATLALNLKEFSNFKYENSKQDQRAEFALRIEVRRKLASLWEKQLYPSEAQVERKLLREVSLGTIAADDTKNLSRRILIESGELNAALKALPAVTHEINFQNDVYSLALTVIRKNPNGGFDEAFSSVEIYFEPRGDLIMASDTPALNQSEIKDLEIKPFGERKARLKLDIQIDERFPS